MVKIFDRSLWEIVTRNLKVHNISLRFIYVCRDEDCRQHSLDQNILSHNPFADLIRLKEVTDGAARSALMARERLDLNRPLLIANSDQFFTASFGNFFERTLDPSLDGLIMSMKASGPKWSYIHADDGERVTLVKEKVEISQQATVGLYYFKRARDFVEAAESMIRKDIRTNNEFYLAPVYNELIEKNKNIFHISFGEHGKDVFGLGTTEDIMAFQALGQSQKMIEDLFK